MGAGGGGWVAAFLDENHESQTSIQCSHLVTHECHEDEDIGLIHLFLGLSLYPIRTSLSSWHKQPGGLGRLANRNHMIAVGQGPEHKAVESRAT